MARLMVSRSRLVGFIGPFLLYAAGCMVTLVIGYVFGHAWLVPLFLTGMAVVFLNWRKILWPDSWSRCLSFGAVLLLICLVNRAFFIANYFVSGPQFDKWPFPVQSPQAAVFKGEVIAILGTLITVFAWRFCGGMRLSPSVIMERPRQTYQVLLIIYAISLSGIFVSERIPQIAALFGQLVPTLLSLGLVSTFLLPMARLRHDLARLLAVVAMSAPFVVVASHSGMKLYIILAVVPSAVMAWRYFRHPLLRVGMVTAGLIGLALITSYVSMYREEVWIRQTQGLATSQTVPNDFVEEIRASGLANTISDGLASFIYRSDGSASYGWAISIADEHEFHPSLVFAPMVYVLIPRILWPGKPPIEQAWEYSGLVFGQRYISWSRSSTAAGYYPALYLGMGWPAVILGALLAGGVLAGTTHLAQRIGGNLTAGLYMFSMLPFMLHMHEGWTVGVLAGPIVACCYVVAVVTLARVIARVTIRTRSARTTST